MSKFDFNTLDFAYKIETKRYPLTFPATFSVRTAYATLLEGDVVSFEALFSLAQKFFIEPLDPTDVELTMFEIEYSEYAKDKYLEIVNYYKGLGENRCFGKLT